MDPVTSGEDVEPWWSAEAVASAAVGRSHGTSRRAPFDRWFRYPAGFASDYVEQIFDGLGIDTGTVIDPFMGSGVTGTAARSRGLDFVGIEAHPMIADLARAKLHITTSGRELVAQATSMATSASMAVASSTNRDITRVLKSETSLVARSFAPAVLFELAHLRDQIMALGDDVVARYLRWALLGTLRDVANVKVGWPYQRPAVARQPIFTSVSARYVARATQFADDIESLPTSNTKATILTGDSGTPETWASWSDRGIASVASPPYLNNFDYADATRLEMYFWGLARTWKELCDTARVNMIVATTQQSNKPLMSAAVAELASLGAAAAEVKELTDKLTEERQQRGSGAKQYDQVVPVYFKQIRSVLACMTTRLRTGARCAWLIGDSAPYGVYVDTPRLIGEVAESVGYKVRADKLLRTRGHRWVGSSRHELQLGERLLVFERLRGNT
jgi:hypothetical protein